MYSETTAALSIPQDPYSQQRKVNIEAAGTCTATYTWWHCGVLCELGADMVDESGEVGPWRPTAVALP